MVGSVYEKENSDEKQKWAKKFWPLHEKNLGYVPLYIPTN